MDFINDDGEFEFEKAKRIIVDTTDGHLSNIPEVEYVGGGSSLLGDSQSAGEQKDTPSRLLSELSSMHSILLDYTIHDHPAEDVLHRLRKKTQVVSKLSDQYAMESSDYQMYHEDISDICQAINNAARET